MIKIKWIIQGNIGPAGPVGSPGSPGSPGKWFLLTFYFALN